MRRGNGFHKFNPKIWLGCILVERRYRGKIKFNDGNRTH